MLSKNLFAIITLPLFIAGYSKLYAQKPASSAGRQGKLLMLMKKELPIQPGK
jgi:hypothetical protein